MSDDLELRSILVATDFGAVAERALFDAGRLGVAFDARVDVVHVLPAFESASSHPEIQALLDSCSRGLAARGARVASCTIARGSAAETILHVAEGSGADLIVIGAGDRAERSLTGPTAETVARFSPKPVWISRLVRSDRLSHVLCAVDSSLASGEALRLALAISRRFDATLELTHVCESSRNRDTELCGLRSELAARGAESLPLHVFDGRASDELCRAAVESGADLVVMGRVGGGLRRVFLGGTAERLLRRLPAALLLTSPRS